MTDADLVKKATDKVRYSMGEKQIDALEALGSIRTAIALERIATALENKDKT